MEQLAKGLVFREVGYLTDFENWAYKEIIMENKLLPKDRFIVASDVDERDGIGVEIYRNNELMVEIFRDDENKTRMITIHKNSISFELMEEAIAIFKREIPWNFID